MDSVQRNRFRQREAVCLPNHFNVTSPEATPRAKARRFRLPFLLLITICLTD